MEGDIGLMKEWIGNGQTIRTGLMQRYLCSRRRILMVGMEVVEGVYRVMEIRG